MSSAEVLRVDAVVRDLDYFGPLQTGRVLDRFAEARRRVAVSDDVEPVAVTAVLGDTPLVGRRAARCRRCRRSP